MGPYNIHSLPLTGSFDGAGNDLDLRYQVEVGDCEFKWARQYGTAWRRSGCLGVGVPFLDTLPCISDQIHRGTV